MKNLKVKAALVLSLLAFSACDKGGGGSNNPQVVGVPGVTARQYSLYAGQSCAINSDNSYTCTEQGRTQGAIRYDSLQSFCSILLNEQTNGYVARNTRQQMYQEQCSGAQNNGFCGVGQVLQNGVCINNTGTINPGTGTIINNPNMKTVACRLAVKQGETVGDTGLMQVQVEQNNSSGVSIYAITNYTFQKKFLGFINVGGTKVSHSEKLGKVKMYYTSAAGKADMIKLEAKGLDNDLTASVTGYAGSEVRLKIAPESEYSDATSVEISCQAQGAALGDTTSNTGYRCSYEETIGSTTSGKEYTSPYNETLMDEDYDITQSLKLITAGELATNAGTASYLQKARSKYVSSVSTIANITTESELKVTRKNSGYSLKVNCQPVRK